MRRLITALTLCICGLALASSAQASSGVALPKGWSPVPWRLASSTIPSQAYAAASFPLRRTPPQGCGPSAAVRAQMPPDGVIVLIESWGQIGEHNVYRPLGPRVDIGRASHYECSGWSYNVRFRVGNEDLQAFIVVKGRPGALHLDQTRQILASIRP